VDGAGLDKIAPITGARIETLAPIHTAWAANIAPITGARIETNY